MPVGTDNLVDLDVEWLIRSHHQPGDHMKCRRNDYNSRSDYDWSNRQIKRRIGPPSPLKAIIHAPACPFPPTVRSTRTVWQKRIGHIIARNSQVLHHPRPCSEMEELTTIDHYSFQQHGCSAQRKYPAFILVVRAEYIGRRNCMTMVERSLSMTTLLSVSFPPSSIVSLQMSTTTTIIQIPVPQLHGWKPGRTT